MNHRIIFSTSQSIRRLRSFSTFGGHKPTKQKYSQSLTSISVTVGGPTQSWRRRERRRPRPGRARGPRCCWSAALCAKAGPDTCRAGLAARPGPCARGVHRNASKGRIPQEACAWPRPGASPKEPSRGRGPGSAQCARGYPGHCVLHGSSVSKSMKPRNEATAGCAQNVRSSCAAGPDVAAAS